MKVEYSKRFLKELARIPFPIRKEIETFVFEEFLKYNTLFESKKVEQLKSYPGFYKIRFGDYRLGIKKDWDTIIFERALHRKDIYRYFP